MIEYTSIFLRVNKIIPKFLSNSLHICKKVIHNWWITRWITPYFNIEMVNFCYELPKIKFSFSLV